MAFHLRKHYLDLCTADGRVRIVYAAQLRWGRVRLGYVSVLRDDGDGAHTTSRVRGVDDPTATDGGLRLAVPSLGVSLDMQRTLAGPCRRLYDTPEGSLDWDCHTLRADVTLHDRGERLVGTGYAETLTATVAPWDLPFDALWWGRAHTPDRALVWTVLEGPGAPAPVYADGPMATSECAIDDQGVCVGGGAREAFVDARVLRTGRIGDTVLSAVPGLQRFPGRILGLSETKCYARTASGGHAIYERVTWPARLP